MAERRGGTIFLNVDGEPQDAKGSFSYNLGHPRKEAIVGASKIHGYKETPQVPFIEGEITDRGTLNLAALQNQSNSTVTLALANGKVVVLRGAWFAGTGDVQTEEGNITVRWESENVGEEI